MCCRPGAMQAQSPPTSSLFLVDWIQKLNYQKVTTFVLLFPVTSCVSDGRCLALSGYRGKDWLEKPMFTCLSMVNMKQNHLWMVNGFKRDDSCKQCKASHSRDLKILYSLWKDFIIMSSSNSSNSHRMLKTNMQPS